MLNDETLEILGRVAISHAEAGADIVATILSRLDPGRVLDRGLQDLANARWEAGAEAIAINGQRLTATSTRSRRDRWRSNTRTKPSSGCNAELTSWNKLKPSA